ncbi:efflux RND transporter periplasmic adaptor subunit [Sinanaerobacter chloroacetimidivorans]|jgi:HlyD family secretion protein|uniref:Efflux RND transporter periplasmic adaptor subunit n=1 Tax=Sinanaerobacter chloroacetimidivorans TaxID=2818044 RepID=A0A8J8B0F1_9FIRM|nr:efflux RND transporter periplasmic adaptor subunit [Sinanaerobacter chloroacetimidivorans]MBR0597114.1 efflux RND transporter periplasmic adaptor subunit [Sinanaerobacter chloroacetimidivorans]
MFLKKNKGTEIDGGTTEKVIKKRKKMSRKKKWILIITIVILLIAVLFAWSKTFSGGPQAPVVTTGTAEKMNIEEVVAIKGTIKGSESADVVSSLNYEIVSILVKEGDVVKKDQVIAVLDGEALENDYKKALSSLEESKFNYEASQLLYQEGAISKEQFIKAKNTYENDKITLDSYNVADKTNLKSPIAGTVTRVNVNLGRYANDTENSEPMFVIEDLDNLKMDVKISEYDISKIKVGQKVTITAEVLGKESVTGTVSRISPTGEPKDATSKEMVIPVQIDVMKGNSKLIAGVTAKAQIQIEQKEDALTVPIDAIMEDPATGESYVMVVDGTILHKIPVVIGLEGDFNIEILSGDLSSGDQVVLSPTFDMTEGMEVTTLPKQ